MQIKVDKKILVEALTLSKNSVDRDNSTNIVYESVLFTSDRDGVWVTATDGSIWSRCLVKAEVRGGTPTLIKSSQLIDIVSGLDDGELEIAHDGHRATLKSGRYRAEFGVADATEFPAPPKIEFPLTAINAGKFIELIRSVEGSADVRADRPYLCGVNFAVRGDDMEAVAADGSRLAHGSLLGGFGGSSLVGTAGTRLARQWASLADLRPVDKSVSFGFDGQWGACLGNDAQVIGLLPDQRFPDWRNATQFPKDGDKRRVVRFDRKALARAAKRVVSIGIKLKGAVSLDLELEEDGRLLMEVVASGRHAMEKLEGHVVDRAFPAQVRRRIGGDLLLQALSSMKASEVNLIMTANHLQPVGVTGVWDKIDDVMVSHWLMPRS